MRFFIKIFFSGGQLSEMRITHGKRVTANISGARSLTDILDISNNMNIFKYI